MSQQVPTPEPATPAPIFVTPTLGPPTSTPSPTGTSTNTPTNTVSPTPTATNSPTNTATPSPIVPTIIYFGGSAGGPTLDTTNMNYGAQPFISGQAPYLADVANVLVPYPGERSEPNIQGKELQASNAAQLIQSNSSPISIGYSAGGDAALIFTHRYKSQFNMIGVGILGSDLDGGIRDADDGLTRLNTNLASGLIQWESMIVDLLNSGIRVYILDDNAERPDYSSSFVSTSKDSNLCYDYRPQLVHFYDTNEGTNSTNRDPNVPNRALSFLRNGDRSVCR